MPQNEIDELFAEASAEDTIEPSKEYSEDVKKIQEEFSNSDLFDED